MKTKSKPTPAQEANIKRFDSRPGRTIVVKGVKWKWKFGGTVCAYSEQGGKAIEQAWKIIGCTYSTWEHDRPPLTPSDIQSWLKDKDPTALG